MELASKTKATVRRGITCKKRPAINWDGMGWWGHAVACKNLIAFSTTTLGMTTAAATAMATTAQELLENILFAKGFYARTFSLICQQLQSHCRQGNKY